MTSYYHLAGWGRSCHLTCKFRKKLLQSLTVFLRRLSQTRVQFPSTLVPPLPLSSLSANRSRLQPLTTMPPVAKRQTTLFYQLIVLSSVASSAWAYSFQFNSTPQQCANLSISITGSGGNPPYRALVIPFGQSPLPNNIEARRIVDQPFPGDSTSVSFQLKYPTNSQFVVVVSLNHRSVFYL